MVKSGQTTTAVQSSTTECGTVHTWAKFVAGSKDLFIISMNTRGPVWVYAHRVHAVSMEDRREHRVPWKWSHMQSWAAWHGSWEPHHCLLQEQHELVTSEPSFQPLWPVFKNNNNNNKISTPFLKVPSCVTMSLKSSHQVWYHRWLLKAAGKWSHYFGLCNCEKGYMFQCWPQQYSQLHQSWSE